MKKIVFEINIQLKLGFVISIILKMDLMKKSILSTNVLYVNCPEGRISSCKISVVLTEIFQLQTME